MVEFSALNIALLAISCIALNAGHMIWSASLDLMNPQNETYATSGEMDDNPNERGSTVIAFIVSALIVYKSVLQAVNRTTWSMISGFTEILGRGGVAVLVVILTENALVGESLGFSIVCLANPAAWLFGLLTVLGDYIMMRKKFKRLAKESS
jgi:hypothetical protein